MSAPPPVDDPRPGPPHGARRDATAAVVITLADSSDFARLSGDFNPMHLDPVRARRTQYGGTVVHGMHLLLASLEAAVRREVVRVRAIEALSVVFSNPAMTGAPVQVSFGGRDTQDRVRITGEHDGRVLFTATVTLRPELAESETPADAPPEASREPVERAMPGSDAVAAQLSGSVPWRMSKTLFAAQFPALAAQPGGSAFAADLLASTCVVGMECPGLHSIYSTLKLGRLRESSNAASQGMQWRVTRTDARFRLVRLAVAGGFFEGSIDAFFRPPPVAQETLEGLLGAVTAGKFSGQRALVVGGSRGLGELTAKLLLAGHADVTITYARGRLDAERICAEATRQGRRCTALALDLGAGAQAEAVSPSLRGAFTHLYYFASPQIAKGTPGQWRPALFEAFAKIYLSGFNDLLAAVAPARGASPAMRVLYPSTVFLDTDEKGFAEYCAAKAAGENLCRHLAAHHGIRIEHPRLPRMRTDQTSGLMESDTEDALAVMRRVLDGFCA